MPSSPYPCYSVFLAAIPSKTAAYIYLLLLFSLECMLKSYGIIFVQGNNNLHTFLQVTKPLNQILSSTADQESGNQIDNDNLSSDDMQRTYTVDEFEVRILEPEKSGGPWQTKATIPMQSSENALTVRMVTLLVSWYFIHSVLCVFSLHTGS